MVAHIDRHRDPVSGLECHFAGNINQEKMVIRARDASQLDRWILFYRRSDLGCLPGLLFGKIELEVAKDVFAE